MGGVPVRRGAWLSGMARPEGGVRSITRGSLVDLRENVPGDTHHPAWSTRQRPRRLPSERYRELGGAGPSVSRVPRHAGDERPVRRVKGVVRPRLPLGGRDGRDRQRPRADRRLRVSDAVSRALRLVTDLGGLRFAGDPLASERRAGSPAAHGTRLVGAAVAIDRGRYGQVVREG